MDPTRFDTLTKSLCCPGTRRGLVRLVAALPLAGALGGLLGEERADGQGNVAGVGGGGGRRRRRRGRHHPGQDKKHRKGKRKQRPQCTPACDICFTCKDGPNTPGTCVVDPAQQGESCGSGGKVCQSDGTCVCTPCEPTSCNQTNICGQPVDCCTQAGATNPGCEAGACCEFTVAPGLSFCSDNVVCCQDGKPGSRSCIGGHCCVNSGFTTANANQCCSGSFDFGTTCS
jgi:hypothetical protein